MALNLWTGFTDQLIVCDKWPQIRAGNELVQGQGPFSAVLPPYPCCTELARRRTACNLRPGFDCEHSASAQADWYLASAVDGTDSVVKLINVLSSQFHLTLSRIQDRSTSNGFLKFRFAFQQPIQTLNGRVRLMKMF